MAGDQVAVPFQRGPRGGAFLLVFQEQVRDVDLRLRVPLFGDLVEQASQRDLGLVLVVGARRDDDGRPVPLARDRVRPCVDPDPQRAAVQAIDGPARPATPGGVAAARALAPRSSLPSSVPCSCPDDIEISGHVSGHGGSGGSDVPR
ncbi:hypothetical protein GCM10017567_11500 [Amycolatopsis bullii]|uniref:Uncharacterized protein n=1 Tax=Amycolatopsis bullii TaxID=941987 RepID=A0ABQ3K207_9PSEU|nr:hypothetical protein GCM10017567_11500 [Amycolatopsis bullii]